jgi:ABC-type oligopeptide transport system substrate-binding subunit
MSLNTTEHKAATHNTGYSSVAYDAIIEAVFAEKNIANRSENLHKAEAELMNDMPVIPIVFNQSAYLINDKVLNLGNKVLFWETNGDYYAPVSFDKATVTNYEKYEEMSETELRGEIQKAIAALNKRLPSFKQIRKIEVRYEPFERTTSKKIQRFKVQ